MKRPSFQFYPGDWLNDAALRMVSVGARGLWIDMICLMHQGSDYGHLKVNKKVILPANLARMVGATLQETEGWLLELTDAGVLSTDDAGCVFSRRMIRDEEVRKLRAEGGKLGGNPKLMAQKEVAPKVNLNANLPPTPSSSSSSSYKNIDPPAKAVVFDFKDALLKLQIDPVMVADWMVVRKAKKAKDTQTAFNGFIREVKKAGFTYDQAVRLCCEKDWKGFDSTWVKDIKPQAPAVNIEAYQAKRAEAQKRYAEYDDALTVWPEGVAR